MLHQPLTNDKCYFRRKTNTSIFSSRIYFQLTSVKMKSCLISTLGTEAQVITTVLDNLLKSQFDITIVNIIHTSTQDTSIQTALKRLRHESKTHPLYKDIKFDFSPIKLSSGEPVLDLNSIESGQAGFQLIYRTILDAKKKGFQVFLCISGGRKNLSLHGMTAAQLLFDENDKLLHLYSSKNFISSKEMHPQNDCDVNLVEIPVLLWSNLSPAYLLLNEVVDPLEAIERYRSIHLEERIENGRIFILSILSPAEQQVVELLVSGGLTDVEIGRILHLSQRTIESHIKSARMKAENYFGLSSINRAGLISLLQPAVIFLRGGKFRENTDVSKTNMN